MHDNMLKLNPDKTEFLIIGNQTQRSKLTKIFPVDLMDHQFNKDQKSIRNLGVMFDKGFVTIVRPASITSGT